MVTISKPSLLAVGTPSNISVEKPVALALTTPSNISVEKPVALALVEKNLIEIILKADTKYITSKLYSTDVDLKNIIQKRCIFNVDSNRKIHIDETIVGDICRILSAQTEKDIVTADTSRNTVVSIISNLAADRHIQVDYVVNIDALRKFSKSEQEQLTFDTARHTVVTVIIQADMKLLHGILEDVSVSTKRTLIKSVINLVSMIRRMPFDTSFIPNRPHTSDPFHIWPKEKPKSGMISMEISLNELSLSDTFRLETTQPVDILNVIKGTIIDYQYQYVIDALDFKDLTRTADGMYDCDAMLYNPITYDKPKFPGMELKQRTLLEHASKIADALGKNLNYKADNWVHTSTWSGDGNTYSSIISTLFGWSSAVPQRQINVFIRAKDNSFNVLQRGMESNTVDVTDLNHTRPEYHREIERTLWATTDADQTTSGRRLNITSGPSNVLPQLSYVNGLLQSESVGDSHISYSYTQTNDGYKLASKITNNMDGSGSKTSYDYMDVGGSTMLRCESDDQWDKYGKKINSRKTYHSYLGNGATSTIAYENGLGVGGSVTLGGTPTVVPSAYSQKVSSGSFSCGEGSKTSWDTWDNDKVSDNDMFPTNDPNALAILYEAIKWLNRKVKETITMNIYDFNHVIDFTDRVRFKGNDYFLVSNTITQTTRELKQRITAVRWY